MQEAAQDIWLMIWQAAVVLSLLFLAVGLAKPEWVLFWMKKPKRVYLFAAGSLLFMGSYFGFSLRFGDPIPIAALQAAILFSVLFLVAGLINPRWVFGTTRLDRLWVMMIAIVLFMGFMTLKGMYYGPKSKRRHPLLSETHQAPQTPATPPTPSQ